MGALRVFASALCLLLIPALAGAQTAIRPDQISPGTPDITWGQVGAGYQIGTTVAWRTISSSTIIATDFLTTDKAKILELTATGAITATLPAATSPWGDGTGFALQVAAGTLTLKATTSTINGITGATGIKIGPYQTVTLTSRSNNWYATISVPQPALQTGATALCDSMVWSATCSGAPINTLAPAVTGSTSLGSVLTSDNGTWSPAATSYAYQWKRDGTTNIGTSATTYTIVAGDQGHSLTDVVTATNASGSASATSNSVSIPSGGSGIVFVQEKAAGSGLAGQASVAVTLPSTVAGNLFVAVVHGYYPSGSVASTTVVTNNTTPCTHSPGTFIIAPSSSAFSDIWYCANNLAAGSVQFTATFNTTSSNQANYPGISVGEFSGALTSAPDAGVGAAVDRSSGSTSQSVTTSGSVPQIGDLVVSGVTPASAGATGVGAGQIVFPDDADTSYQITTATGSVSHSFTFPSSQTGALSIAAFKHP